MPATRLTAIPRHDFNNQFEPRIQMKTFAPDFESKTMKTFGRFAQALFEDTSDGGEGQQGAKKAVKAKTALEPAVLDEEGWPMIEEWGNNRPGREKAIRMIRAFVGWHFGESIVARPVPRTKLIAILSSAGSSRFEGQGGTRALEGDPRRAAGLRGCKIPARRVSFRRALALQIRGVIETAQVLAAKKD